jgi:hypothetical protein
MNKKKVLGVVFGGMLTWVIVSYSIPKRDSVAQGTKQPQLGSKREKDLLKELNCDRRRFGKNGEALQKKLDIKAKAIIQALEPVSEGDGMLEVLAKEVSLKAQGELQDKPQEAFRLSVIQSSIRGLVNSAKGFIHQLKLEDGKTEGRVACAMIAFGDFVERVKGVYDNLENVEGLNLEGLSGFYDKINEISQKNYLESRKK